MKSLGYLVMAVVSALVGYAVVSRVMEDTRDFR